MGWVVLRMKGKFLSQTETLLLVQTKDRYCSSSSRAFEILVEKNETVGVAWGGVAVS